MRVRVLGAVELAATNGEPTLARWPRVRKLLAVLLVHAGDIVSVDRLGDALWGGEAPIDRSSAVHNLVYRLRMIVRSAGAADTVRVVTRAPGYVLEVNGAEVDSTRFAELVETARDRLHEAPQMAAALLDEALSLWRGPAFAEFADEEFVRAEAGRLDELRGAAAADRVEAAIALGRHDEAIGMLEPLRAADPLGERPRRQLMRALHGVGRSVEALQVYRDYRDLLAELGLDPSPELRELEAAIIRHEPSIGWIGPTSPANNLPQEPGELVGRADDVIQVTDAMRRARLVTLTGVGGVGKTRLALHVAAVVGAEHPDGVWLCELAPVGASSVAEVLAAALEVRQRHGLTMTARLAEYLREKRLLIVLDNCEHVTATAAQLVDALLRSCPRVRVLATSREGLDVDGERVLPVAPLETPARGASSPETIAGVASVALFVQRASAASASFELTADNSADVAEICRRLDGLPLALELVAPKVRSLSAAEIAARLDRRLPFIRTAGWIREQRHRTLRAVVDWSHQLLDERQQQLFERLSVFVGSFTLDGAERVAGGRLDPAEIADVITALVDRSMLGAQPGRAPTRYALLETLRLYGRERLRARGWETATRRDHADYHVELAVAASTGLTGRDPGRWVKVMDQHLDDLRAAHTWAVAHDPDLAMRLSAALFWYLEPGTFSEGVGWAERAIAASPPSHPLLPVVTSVAAFGASKRGDLAAARRLAARGLEISGERNPIRRYPMLVLGDVALFQGRLAESGRCYAEAARLATQAHDTYTYTYSVVNLAFPLAYQGASARALAAAQRGRSAATDSGSPHLVGWADYALGEVLADTDPERAMAALDTALVAARESGSRFLEGVALVTAASLQARHGDPRAALEPFGRVVDRWHRAGNWTQQWITLRNVIDLFARLSADEPAVVLSGAMRASRSAAPLFGSDAARLAEADAALRAGVSEQTHRQWLARGAAMTDDEVVSFAIAEINRLRTDPPCGTPASRTR